MGPGRRRQRNPDNLPRTTFLDIKFQPASDTQPTNKGLETSHADMPRHKRGYKEAQEKFLNYRNALPALQPNPRKETPTTLGPPGSTLREVASINNPEGKRTRDYPVSTKMRASQGRCTLQGPDGVWRSHMTTIDLGRRCSSTVDIRASIADHMGFQPKRFPRKVYRKLNDKSIKGIGTVTLPMRTLTGGVEHREAVVWEDKNVTFDVRFHRSIASSFVKVDEIDSPPPSPRGVLRHADPVPPAPPSTPVESTEGGGSEAVAQPWLFSFDELVGLLDADLLGPLSPLIETTLDVCDAVETADIEPQATGPSSVAPDQAGKALEEQPIQRTGPVDDFILEPLDNMKIPSTQTEEVAYNNDGPQAVAGTLGLASNQAGAGNSGFKSNQAGPRSYENTMDQPVDMDFQMFPPRVDPMDFEDTSTRPGVINHGNAFLSAEAPINQFVNQTGANSYVPLANPAGAIGVGQFANQAGAVNFGPVNQMAVGFNQGTAYNNFGNMMDLTQYGQLNQTVSQPQPQAFGMNPMSFNTSSYAPVRPVQRQQPPVRWNYTRRSAQFRTNERRHVNIHGTYVPTQTSAQSIWMGGSQNEPQPHSQPLDETLPSNFQNNQDNLDWVGAFSTWFPNNPDQTFFDSSRG
ncbi:hypothetical protein B0T10DRAFT_247664 [Thelonectria olida]|uniref:Uncharacterized protein n=1 Tax=Thelonectria olida TaxID=1576542 RepID=A0A9P8WCJ9_9HYPO|nr:hypothetical protein B0T10DRAFT_247664 [Thelonectria olida]